MLSYIAFTKISLIIVVVMGLIIAVQARMIELLKGEVSSYEDRGGKDS